MPACMGWGLVRSEGVEWSRLAMNRGVVGGMQEEAGRHRSEELSCLPWAPAPAL